MKNYIRRTRPISNQHFLLTMKLTGILLIVSLFSVQANTYSQKTKVSLQMDNVAMGEVFAKIEALTDFKFFYDSKKINVQRKVTIEVSETSISEVLNLMFKGSNIYYLLQKKQIILKVHPQTSLSSVGQVGDQGPPINEVMQLTVSGLITDSNGIPIPGASVLEKGTTNGVAADFDGNYQITLEGSAPVLVFSSIGFARKEIAVGTSTQINVVLLEDTQNLDEVVVTALGIKREAKTLGYATATATSEDIGINKTTNFMNALQGKMAGVNITQMGTGPAGSSKIRIRGQSSLGGNNSPLIVVNGIPINNNSYGVGGGNNPTRGTGTSDGGDGLSSINPDDVESMTVLKGAAAAALYGARAKDGVIMITTRNRGTGQGIGLEYSSSITMDQALDYTDYQDQYGQGENGVRPTSPNPTSGVFSFGEKFEPGMTQILFDGIEVPYKNQGNRYKNFYRTGLTLTNTISVASSGEKGGFNLSVSNLDNKSIVPNSKYNRKTINIGFTQNFGEKLNVSGNINYSYEENTNPPVISGNGFNIPLVINTLATSLPIHLLDQYRYDENGNEWVYSRFRNRTNPFISAYNRFENISRDRIFGNITARYNVLDWIYIQGRIGQDYFSRARDYNNPTGTAFLSPAPSGFFNGLYNQEASRFRELNADFLIGANRTFDKIGVNLTLGGNQRYVRSDRNSVFVQDFIIRDLYTVMNGRAKEPEYSLTERQINSLYGALELSYNDVLFLNATARNDWFSTLSPENRSILYPSVTTSFVFSQAFEESMPDWITFGKIRASYAQVGSDLDIAPYSDRLFYDVNPNLFPSYNGSQQPLGQIDTSVIPNADLHPMSVSEAEFGFDLRMFDNRVGLDLTYYTKLSTDQILSAQTSDASGYTSRLINVGESRSTGLEMLLTTSPIRNENLRWDVDLNLSYNTSEVLKLGESDEDVMIGGNLRYVVGEPLGQIYGFGYLRDADGQQVFDKATGLSLRTPEPIRLGSALPKYFGGITNTIKYKDFNFSFLIDFKLGHDMFSQTNWNAYRHGLHKATLVGRENNYVVGVGVNQDGGVNQTQAPLQQFYTIDNTQIREGFVQNAGFWKLRQISLGYDFAKMLPQNSPIKGVRLSAIANNVAILKKWIPNIDPEEFSNVSDTSMGLGGDGGQPTTRSIGFNLNVKF